VLNYIQELQKEVEDLTHEKEELLSKADTLQGDDHDEEEKPSKKPRITKDMNKRSSSMCSVSIDQVEEKEIVIHISTSQRITSMPEVLLLLDKCGFLVMHLSCFQSFGGRSFYHLHLAVSTFNHLLHISRPLICPIQLKKRKNEKKNPTLIVNHPLILVCLFFSIIDKTCK